MDNFSIAVITPIYNPTSKQLSNYINSITEIKKITPYSYACISKKTRNINELIEILKNNKIKYFIFNDSGPTDSIKRIKRKISHSHIWLLTCGEKIKINKKVSSKVLENIDSKVVIYGRTNFIIANKSRESHSNSNIRKYYKYKIPIFNINSAIFPSDIFFKSLKSCENYRYASDYCFILNLFKENISFKYIEDLVVKYFEDGLSFNNQLNSLIEMYFLSKLYFPKLPYRDFFYFIYAIRRGINPFVLFWQIFCINKKESCL
jgi:hypothetical protein